MARNWWKHTSVRSSRLDRKPRLAIESLEARIVPVSHLAYTSPGGGLTLKLNGATLQVVNAANTVVASQALVDTSGVDITGSSAANDALTVDFDNGGFFKLTDGVVFAGGLGGNDSLTIIGQNIDGAVYTPTAVGAATVQVSTATPASTDVRGSGLEGSIAIRNLTSLSFHAPLGAENLTIGNGQNNTGVISGVSGSFTVPPVEFKDINNVTVDLASLDNNEADTVTVTGNLLAGGLQNLTVNTGGGNDTFTVQGDSLTLPRSGGKVAYDGGTGNNTLVFDRSAATRDQTLSLASGNITDGGTGRLDFSNVFSVSMSGGSGNDEFDLTGHKDSVTVDGGAGRDTIWVEGNTDETNLSGTYPNQTLSLNLSNTLNLNLKNTERLLNRNRTPSHTATLTPTIEGQVLAGIDGVGVLLENLSQTEELGRTLPIVDSNLAHLSGMGQALAGLSVKIAEHLAIYRNSHNPKDPDSTEIRTYLQSAGSGNPLTFTVTDAKLGDIEVKVYYVRSDILLSPKNSDQRPVMRVRVETTRVSNLSLGAAELSSDLGLTFAPGGSAGVTLTTTGQLYFAFDYDAPNGDAMLDLDRLEVNSSTTGTQTVTGKAAIGFLGVDLSGTLRLNAYVPIMFNPPVPDPFKTSNVITGNPVEGYAARLVIRNPDGTLAGTSGLYSATFNTTVDKSVNDIKFFNHKPVNSTEISATEYAGQVVVGSTDFLHKPLSIKFFKTDGVTEHAELRNFTYLSAEAALGVLAQLQAFLAEVGKSAALSKDIPFAAPVEVQIEDASGKVVRKTLSNLGDVVNFGQAFQDDILRKVSEATLLAGSALPVADHGVIAADDTFTLEVNGKTLTVTVRATDTTGNTSLDDLATDVKNAINAALTAAGVTGVVCTVDVPNGALRVTMTGTLGFGITADPDTAKNPLGFPQSARSAPTPVFIDAQGLAHLIAQGLTLAAGTTVTVVPEYDAYDTTDGAGRVHGNELTFRFNWAHNFADVKLPVDFGTSLGDFSGITGAPSVSVQSTGVGVFPIHFSNALGHKDVDPVTVDASKLTNGAVGGTASVVETTKGNTTRDEVQTLTVTADGGTFTLTYKGQTTDPLPYNANALAIQQALAALPVIRELGALPVKATTTMALTFGVELTATPQARLGLIAANAAQANVDPDLIVAAPLATRPVDRLGPSDTGGSTSILVNGRRVDFTVPSASATNATIQVHDPIDVVGTSFGYSSMSFTLVVGGTTVPVSVPGAIFSFFSGGMVSRVNDAIASALSGAGVTAGVYVSLTPLKQLVFATTASGLVIKDADGAAQDQLGLPAPPASLSSGSSLRAPTLIADQQVSTVVAGQLSGLATFSLTVGGSAPVDVIVRKKDTLNNGAPTDALAADVEDAINAALGLTDPTDAGWVQVSADANGRLTIKGPTTVGTAQLEISAVNDIARGQLGLVDGQKVSKAVSTTLVATNPIATSAAVPAGQLTGDAVFSIKVNGGAAKVVTVARTATLDNSSPLDGLVADIQTAIRRAGADVTVSRIGRTLVFGGPPDSAHPGETLALSVSVQSGDPANTQLGLGLNQTGTSQADAERVARAQRALDAALVGIGLGTGDVVIRVGTDGKFTYGLSDPGVYDVQGPTQVLAGTATPIDGFLGADAHFDLVLNDADVLHVTVPQTSFFNYRPFLQGDAVPTGTIEHDAEFILTVVRTAGTSQTVKVTARAADLAAALGFAGRAVAKDQLTAGTILTAAQAKLASDATFTLSFDKSQPAATSPGANPVDVTVFAAETQDNTSVRDLVADVNAAIGRAGLTDRVYATLEADKVVLRAVDPDTGAGAPDTYITLTPAANTIGSGTSTALTAGVLAAIDSALKPFNLDTRILVGMTAARELTLQAALSSQIRALTVDVPPADPDDPRQPTSLGLRDQDADSPVLGLARHVQTYLNNAIAAYGHGYAAGDLVVYALGDVSSDTSRFVIGAAKRTGTPITTLRLIARRNDPAVSRLGFDDLNPPGTVRPVELAARAKSDNFFLRDVTLQGSMTGAASLPVVGTYGFVGFDGTASFGTTGSPAIAGSAALAFVNPTGEYPRIALGDLRTAAADGTLADPTVANVTLTGKAKVGVDLVPTGNFLGPTPRPATFTVGNWVDNDTAVSVDDRNLGDLYMFRGLRLPAVLSALHQVADYLRGLDDPRLAAELPLVNRSVKDLLDYAGQFDDFVSTIGAVEVPNLQAMAALVKGALGYPIDSNQVAWRLDNSVAGKPALRLDLLFATGGVQSYSLDLDLEQLFRLSGSPEALDDIKRVLQGNSGTAVPYLRLTALNSGGKIDAAAVATLRLSLGFDLATPGTTGLEMTVPQDTTVATIVAGSPFAPAGAGELSGDSTFELTVTGPTSEGGTVTVTVPVTVTQAMTAGAVDSTALAAVVQAQIKAALTTALMASDVVQGPTGPPTFTANDVLAGTRDVTVVEGGLPSITAADGAGGPRMLSIRFIRDKAATNLPLLTVNGAGLIKLGATPTITVTGMQDGKATAPKTDETQKLFIDATGGTFTLTLGTETTGAIAFDADPNAIAAAVAALPGVGRTADDKPNARVQAYTTFDLRFVRNLGGRNVGAIGFDGSALIKQAVDDAGATSDQVPDLDLTTLTDGGGGNDEVQRLYVDGTGGQFTLRFNGNETAPIPVNATAAVIAQELAKLPDLAPPEHAWTVTFTGAHRRQAIPDAITADVSNLVTADLSLPRVLFDTLQTGNASANEVRVIQVDATGGTFTLTFNGQTTTPLAYNASGAEVAAALGKIVGGNTIKVYSRNDSVTALVLKADADDPLVTQLGFTGSDTSDTHVAIAGSVFAPTTAGTLRGDAIFTLEIHKDATSAPTVFDVFLPQSQTTGLTDAVGIVALLQAALNTALTNHGMATGDVAVHFTDGNFSLQANPVTAIQSIRLLAPVNNPARTELGLGAIQQGATSAHGATAPNTPQPGILSAPATFTLRLTDAAGTAFTLIEVDPTATNLSLDDLKADVQNAVNTALTGLTTSTVTVSIDGDGKLAFTGSAGVTDLRIVTTNVNPVQSQLGFDGDVTGDTGNLTLDDLRQDVQAAVESALATTAGFRAGDVLVGIETTAGGGIIRFGRRTELGFGPVQEAAAGSGSAVIQAIAPIKTPKAGILSSPATFTLKVVTGSGTQTVNVSVPVDSTNVTVADLVADVQAALVAAGLPAGRVTVSVVPAEFTAPGVARDNFLALTGGAGVQSLKLTASSYLSPPVNVPASGRLDRDYPITIDVAATSPSLEPFLYDGAPATAGGLQIGGTELKVETQLVSQGAGVHVTGSGTAADPFKVEFINGFGKQDVPLLGKDTTAVFNSAKNGLGDVLVDVLQDGSDSQNEIQTLTLVDAASGYFILAFQGETTDPITLPATAAKIEQALIGLDNLGGAFTAVIGPVAFKAKKPEALLDADGAPNTLAPASFIVNLANTNNKTLDVRLDSYATQAYALGGGVVDVNQLGTAATFNVDFVRAAQPGTVQHLAITVPPQPVGSSLDQLVAGVQAALDAALATKGLSAGEVIASVTTGNNLRVSGDPRDGIVSVVVSGQNAAAIGGLGLTAMSTGTGNQVRAVLGGAEVVSAPSGVLSAKATFTLILAKDGNPLVPVVVDVNRDTTNTTLAALLADVQSALNPLLVARGFANNDVTVGLTAGNVLTLTAKAGAGITSMRVGTSDGNPARTQLGLPADAVSDFDKGLTDLVPDIQAVVDAALMAAGNAAGDVVVGFTPATLMLTFTPKAGSGLTTVAVAGGSAALALPGNGQVAQPLAFTLYARTTGTGDGRHPLGTPAEAVADASLGVVGGMALNIPFYNINADESAGGLALQMPDLDAFFKTQDPVSPTPLTGNKKVTFTDYPDFSQAEVPIPITNPDDAQQALIDDPGLMFDGLEGYFDGLQSQIDSQAGSGQMPLLGDAAKEPLQFVTELKESLLTKMKDTWSKLLSAPDPNPSKPAGTAPAGVTTYAPIKDRYIKPPDRTIEAGKFVSEEVPNDALAILHENWGHLGRLLNPFVTLKNTLYNLFGPTPERVKEYYGIVAERDTITVGVAWDETQGLQGEPKYTVRQQLLDKYQEHMNEELAKVGFYAIDGQPSVFAEFGPTGEAGEPFYRFTPYLPPGGWTAAQLTGAWNKADKLLHLKGLTSTLNANAEAVLTASDAVYAGATATRVGLLDGGFGPMNLQVTSDNYGTISLFLDLSERGVLAGDLQAAIDTAVANWNAVPGAQQITTALSVGLSALGRITITAGDDTTDDTVKEMIVTPVSGAAPLGFVTANAPTATNPVGRRITAANTVYPAAVAGTNLAAKNGRLAGDAVLRILLKNKDGSSIDLPVTVHPRTPGDTAALVTYLQSVVDGALDDAGKAALGAGDITVGLDATNKLTFTGSILAGITALKTDMPTNYKTVSSDVILGTTDFTPTPEDGVIEKGFDLELELWLNTPAPASVFQVAPLRTGKAGITDVIVRADPTKPNEWVLEFTGDYKNSPPAIRVRTNVNNPLHKLFEDPGTHVKSLVPGTVTYDPATKTIKVDADEGGFDLIITKKDGTVFETNAKVGDYGDGIEAGASVDDIAGAIAGPNTDTSAAKFGTGFIGLTDLTVTSTGAGTWDITYVGDLAANQPTITVRSNARNPLKKGGSTAAATISTTPAFLGQTITVDADAGAFDIVVTRADGSKFETSVGGTEWAYKAGIAFDAGVDDVRAAVAGPNPDVLPAWPGAENLLRKLKDATEADTGLVTLTLPPPTTDDVEVELDMFEKYESGPKKGLPIVPFKVKENASISVQLRLGMDNLLERFVQMAVEKYAKEDPSRIGPDGEILLGKDKNIKLYPNVPGFGTVIAPPKVGANSNGFGVDLDAALTAKIGWDVTLGFGVSRKEKFFINTAKENEIKLGLSIGLAGTELDGPANFAVKLGPLVGKAADQYPTAPYSTFLMDLNLVRYRVPVPVLNFKNNTLLGYTGTDASHPEDLLSDLNSALKGFLPTIGFKTDDVVAVFKPMSLADLQDALAAALGKDVSLGSVTVTKVSDKIFDINFDGGRFAKTDVAQFTGQDTALAYSSGARGSLVIDLRTTGSSTANEIQRITIGADAGTFTLTFNGQTTVPIKFDATAVEIQEAINALAGFRGIPAALADATGALIPLSIQQKAIARTVYAQQFELKKNGTAGHTFRQNIFAVGLVPAGLQLDPKMTGKLLADAEDGDPDTPAPFPQNALFQDDKDLLPSGLTFSFAIDLKDPDANRGAIPVPVDGVLRQDLTFDLVVKKTTAIERGGRGGNAALIKDPTEEYKLTGLKVLKKYTDGLGDLVGTKLVGTKRNKSPNDLAKDIQDAIDAYLSATTRPSGVNASEWSALIQNVKAGDITVTYNRVTKAFEFKAADGGTDATTRARRANIREIKIDADGDRLSVAELVRSPKDAFRVTATGNLNINTKIEISFKRPSDDDTNPLMPKFSFDLAVDKPLFAFDTELSRLQSPAGGPEKGTKPFPTPSNGQLGDDVTIILLLTGTDGVKKWPFTVREFDTHAPKLNLSDPDKPTDNQDLQDLREDIKQAMNAMLKKRGVPVGAIEVSYDTKSGQYVFIKSSLVKSFITAVSYRLKTGETKLANVAIDLGSFIGDMAGPILQKVEAIVSPFDWLIGDQGLLTRRLPVISDLNGRDTSLLDLAGQFGANKTAKTLNALREIRATTKTLGAATKDAKGSVLPLGTIKLDGTGNGYSQVQGAANNGANRTGQKDPNAKDPVAKPGPAKNFFANTQRGSFDLAFPILTEPRMLLDALAFGKFDDVTLVTLGLPHFEFNFNYEQRFQIFGPLFATLGGFFSASIDVGVGFDMSGVAKYKKTGRVGDIFDGFYISDRTNPNGSGADRPELSFTGGIYAGAELSLGVASAGVQGGITATVDFNLNDPNNDGRVRLSEMLQNIKANDNDPFAIFDIGGRIGWFFRAYVEALGGLFRFSKDLGSGTIFEFTVPFKRLPVLGVLQSGGQLLLNTGPTASARINGNIDGDAGESFSLSTEGNPGADGSLTVVIRFGGAEVTYDGVKSVEGTGGAGNDTYDFRGVTAGNLVVIMAGGGGADTMYAGAGIYSFFGDDGNDVLVGGAGNDVFDGGAGDDSLSGSGGNDSLTGGDGTDTVTGGAGNDSLDGGAGNDSLAGGVGNDVYVVADGWGSDTVGEGDTEGNDAWDLRTVTAPLTFRVSEVDAGGTPIKQTAVTDYSNRMVAFNFGIELLLGGRAGDKFNIAATGAKGIVLDGGRGSDTYLYDLATLASSPTIADSGPIWNTDTLVLQGSADPERYDLGPTGLVVSNLHTLAAPVPLTYSGGGIEALEVNGKGGSDVVNVVGTDGSTRYTINTGEGDDTVNIGVDATAAASPADLSQMRGDAGTGPLVVRGNSGQDSINVYDTTDTTNRTGALTPNRVVGLGMRVGIKYLSFEDMNLVLGSGNDNFTIEGTHASQRGIPGIPASQVTRTTKVDAGTGDDKLFVKTVASTTTVLGGSGDDTFYVADDLTTTDQIFEPLTIDGGTATTKDILTVDDSEDRSPNVGELTATKITGLDMRGDITYANVEELHLKLGQGPDGFFVRGTNAATPVSLTGGGGNDIITVGSTGHTLIDVLGGLDVDAGEGANQLVLDNRGSATGAHPVVLNDQIQSFAPVPVYYRATNGSFDGIDPEPGTGVLLRGSTTARDAFLVKSTLAGSTTAVEGNGGNDVYYVAALPPVPVAGGPDTFAGFPTITDNGNLDAIAGRLRVVQPATVAGGAVYVNDHGNPLRANYTVGGGMVQVLDDPTNPAPARAFGGVDYGAGVSTLRVDATDDVNVFDAKPSTTANILISANLPVGGHPLPGGGDYLRLDTTGTKGRKLHITAPGNGYWSFTDKNRLPLVFESIERFNHVNLVGYNGDVGKKSLAPYVSIRDAETGTLKFAKMAYAASFRGGVRFAFADMNYDGLPDLVTVSGPGRVAEVHVYDGAPDAKGKYSGKLLTSFPVLPVGVKTGAFIALGDVNYDGANDIVIGADAGWVPQVSVWDGRTSLSTHQQLVTPFQAYANVFRGGVRVAVGDIDTTNGAATSATRAEIITGSGKGMAPTVGIWGVNGPTANQLRSFYVFPPNMTSSGIYVAVGDYNGDGVRDVIASTGQGVAPKINIFSGKTIFLNSGLTQAPSWTIAVKPTTYRGGVSVVPVPKNGGNPGAVEWDDLRTVLGKV